MPFRMIHGNIVDVEADAIVNAANTRLMPGGGVCGAIFEAAGFERLYHACQAIGYCEAGQSVATPAFDLKAKYIIHTPGPIWEGGAKGEAVQLASCYTTAMQCAVEHRCRSIAFPLISAGIFGYPKRAAYQVAREAIRKFIDKHDILVELVIFEAGDDITGYGDRNLEMRLEALSRQINHREDVFPDAAEAGISQKRDVAFGDESLRRSKAQILEWAKRQGGLEAPRTKALGKKLEEVIEEKKDSFSAVLMQMIAQKGVKPASVYRKANIDRRHFSKIKGNLDYVPSKQTAVSFAVALELDIHKTQALLASAGYILSESSRFDIIVKFFIENGVYDIFQINDALFHYDQPLLGSF